MAEYIEREALLKEIKEWVEEVVSPSLFGKLEDLLAMDNKLLKAYWPISASVLPNTFLMHVTPDELADVVESVPAADVVEVVRCKDCKFQIKAWHKDGCMKDGGYWVCFCARNEDQFVGHAVNGYDDEFCSYGERKE